MPHRWLTSFLWILVTPVVPAEGGATGFFDSDGGASLLLLAAYGAPRRHSRACPGLFWLTSRAQNHLVVDVYMPHRWLTSFLWILVTPVVPAEGGATGFFDSDGVRQLRSFS